MSTSRRYAILLAVLFAGSVPGRALAWPPLPEDGPRTPLLGGRWTVLLGPEASTAAAVADPRGPAPRSELDGVATMRTDEGRLALRATLLYATRPADLEAVVRTLPAPCDEPTVAAFPEHEGIVAISCAEPSMDGAFRPLVLFATHTDGWVDRIEVQLETDEATDQAQALAFATAVAQSLRAEDVAPAVERGAVEIARACVSGDDGDAFTVTLPEGWIAARQGDASLSLYQLVRVIELGGSRPIASVAFSPSRAAPARIPAGAGTRRDGSLLGTSVEWLEIVGPGDAPGIRELALDLSVACGEGTEPWTGMVQLSAGGPSSTLDESTRVLETFAMASGRGHTPVATPIGTEEEAAPLEITGPESPEDAAAEETGHYWSMGIGAVSLLLLVIALVLRGRTTRPK